MKVLLKTTSAILDRKMNTDIDNKYMQRCLTLALKGRAKVKPNPMVGCVIVYRGKIIGESYHKEYGKAHAEVNAINSVKNHELLKEATLYVNLEPCAHHGKTPPCSDLIVAKKLKRVVVGCKDSFAKVAGKGIEKMQRAGIEVKVGVLENESLELNKSFFTFHSKKRPYVILKWAQTLDSYIDVIRKPSDPIGVNWITHPYLKMIVHKWRSEESAIMVGAGTAINDNPRLDTREWFGKNPLRLLISEFTKINFSSKLLDNTIPTIIFTNSEVENRSNTEFINIDFNNNPIKQVLDYLYKAEIQSVIVEGGQLLLQSFIDEEIWDEARVLIGDKTFGEGLAAPKLKHMHKDSSRFFNDTIIYYNNIWE